MGLREDREAKKQEKIEKQQEKEKRKPRMTYVHGIDGRRYINDKILRNLEGSQGGQTFSAYTSVSNYAANGYLSYDDLMEETEKLTLEASEEQQNSVDEFARLANEGVSITHAQGSEIVNADLEAAFEKAASLGRTVHTTLNDMTPGAYQTQAFNNAPPEAQVHGFNETQAAPEAHAEKITGDLNTTVYDGYHEAAQNAPFAFPPAMSDEAFNAAYQQQADEFAPLDQQSTYATPGTVGKPKGISARPSKYGMLADGNQSFEESRSAQQQASSRKSPSRLEMSTSQQMRALPPPVPIEHNQVGSAPAQGKAEYNKLLGGLFKDSGNEKPAQSAPSHVDSEQPPSPSFNEAVKQAQSLSQSNPPAEQLPPQEPQYDQVTGADNSVRPESAPSKDSLVDFPSTGEQPKPKFDRKKPPLPKQRADEIYFEDNATSGKTSIFKMPSEGVVVSSRGTVELLVHKGGRMFRPHYNPVGILLRVDVSDGFSLIKGQTDKAPWRMTDRDGNPLDEDDIFTVAFDKKGNLWYQTVNGKKTRFLVDGGVEVTTSGGEKTKLS